MSRDTATIVLGTPIREGCKKTEYRCAVYQLSFIDSLDTDPFAVVRTFGKSRVFTKRGAALCYAFDKDGGDSEHGVHEVRLSRPFDTLVGVVSLDYQLTSTQVLNMANEPFPHRVRG